MVVNGLAMEELHLNRGVRREEINASAMEKEEYRLVGREGVREGRKDSKGLEEEEDIGEDDEYTERWHFLFLFISS